MAQTIKQCAFCGQDGPHPKAHIFPKALLRGDPGVPFMLFSLDGTQRVKRSQTGLYDGDLWCRKCEGRSAEWDQYAAETLLNESGRSPVPNFLDNKGKLFIFEIAGADPVQIALFTLSVLWRASASKLAELRGFTLGPYQDRVKDAIATADPAKLAAFPLLIRFETGEIGQGGFIMPGRVRGGEFVVFNGGGFEFNVKVNNRKLDPIFAPWAIVPDAPVRMVPYEFMKTKTGKETQSGVKTTERKFGPQNRYFF